MTVRRRFARPTAAVALIVAVVVCAALAASAGAARPEGGCSGARDGGGGASPCTGVRSLCERFPAACPAEDDGPPTALVVAGGTLGAGLVIVGATLTWRARRRRSAVSGAPSDERG